MNPIRPLLDDNARAGNSCCEWSTFRDGFEEAYAERFDMSPNVHAWSMARRDWRKGNNGWEAAHNAMRRARTRVARGQISKESK